MKKKPEFYVAVESCGNILCEEVMQRKELEDRVESNLNSDGEGKIIIYKLVPVMELEYKGVVKRTL